MPAAAASRRKIPGTVVLLGFASLLNDASSDIIYPLLPIFLSTYAGATPLIIGMIEGVADAIASILKLFAGIWSDRISRRKPFVVSGYALAGASRVLIAAATHWVPVFG
ncbi:MAG TPA: MFS transporter, partial [Thermoanaerobaculia bacterium]|nr:MFS transporter [Thermoanaerobaculia bacterium]